MKIVQNSSNGDIDTESPDSSIKSEFQALQIVITDNIIPSLCELREILTKSSDKSAQDRNKSFNDSILKSIEELKTDQRRQNEVVQTIWKNKSFNDSIGMVSIVTIFLSQAF